MMSSAVLGRGGRPANGARAVLFLEITCVCLWLAHSVLNSPFQATNYLHGEIAGCVHKEQGRPSMRHNFSAGAASPFLEEEQDEPVLKLTRYQIKNEFMTSLSKTATPTSSSTTSAPAPSLSPRPRVFNCGYQDLGDMAAASIFSDFDYPGNYHYRVLGPKRTIKPTPSDVIAYGMHGRCASLFDNNVTKLMEMFPGKVIFLNGESWGDIQEMSPSSSERLYQLGPYLKQQHWQHNTLQVYFLVMTFQKLAPELQQSLMDHSKKPINTGLYKSVAYFNSNCVPYRQQAARDIAELIQLHHVKECRVNATKASLVPKPDFISNGKRGAFTNYELFHQYKYCLVMENKVYPGYITEKILNAFLGGCVPIYYGTTEIFQLFNPKSFVFYNISNPQPAMEQLKRMQQDEAEYNRTLYEEPILASPLVLKEYFSLSDEVGGGHLKQRIRQMMGITETWDSEGAVQQR